MYHQIRIWFMQIQIYIKCFNGRAGKDVGLGSAGALCLQSGHFVCQPEGVKTAIVSSCKDRLGVLISPGKYISFYFKIFIVYTCVLCMHTYAHFVCVIVCVHIPHHTFGGRGQPWVLDFLSTLIDTRILFVDVYVDAYGHLRVFLSLALNSQENH